MNRRFYHLIKNIFSAALVILLSGSCNNSSHEKENLPPKRDTTITAANAYSSLELDSMKLEDYILKNHLKFSIANEMRSFYRNRNYHFAWFGEDGLTEQGSAFYNLHNTYVKADTDTSHYDKQLHAMMERLIKDNSIVLTSRQITQTELHLTQHFFKFTKEVYEGTIDPLQLQWHIPKKKIDVIKLLDSLIARNGKKLENWEPVNRFYPLLRNKLVAYYEIDKKGGWDAIHLNNKIYKPGDSGEAILALKKRLSATGDYKGEETSMQFTRLLELSLKHVQNRLGLKADGVLGLETANELNVSVKDRIEQILVNMERLKWMPNESSGTRLVANIPEFRLHVFNGNQQQFSMKIVVGKAGHNTVIFTDSLESIVLCPYWNIPPSIVRNEILPALKKDKNYLAKNNMQQTGTEDGLPVIRQDPGSDNSLGRIKFVFPNNYNIYFHDTPVKQLFDQNDRAFSHGCIRLENAQKLAEYLLRNNPDWPESKIIHTMDSGKNTWIKLQHKIPVYIVYFTAWVSTDGTLNFRDDLYGHDARMKKMMFKEH